MSMRTPSLFAAAFLSGFAWVAPAGAQVRLAALAPLQAPQAPAGQAPAEDAEASRELNRILYLTDRSSLRGKARFREGRWELRDAGEWQPIAAERVARVALERDVEAEAARLGREVAPEDLQRRVELARWLAGAGLTAEALTELGSVLERDASCAAALELLASRTWVRVPSLYVPEAELDLALVALYDWAVERPRAFQELAILEFASARERAGFSADVAKALGSGSSARRAFATRLLARLFPGQALEPLLVHAVLDMSPDVRKGACEALAATGDPGVAIPIARALETSSSSLVRGQAAQALGHLGFEAAIPVLLNHLATTAPQASASGRLPHSNLFIGKQFAYIQDFDVEVAQFQSIADPQINVLIEGSALDAAVVSSREAASPVERANVRTALRQLSGTDAGTSTSAWLAWWDANRAEFEARAAAAADPGSRAGS